MFLEKITKKHIFLQPFTLALNSRFQDQYLLRRVFILFLNNINEKAGKGNYNILISKQKKVMFSLKVI